ncbi:Nodulation protein N [Caballeronia sordidicola]|uniref:Nodulation protein N n=1 Tax=Caballeronia sordidicola TaxID=196367 RepID=A0A242MRV7_CABSO|nr:Nodulation protein N [Caballeronia sordidicola]
MEHLLRDDGHSRARHAGRFHIDGLARARQHPLAQAGSRERYRAVDGARVEQACFREQAGSRHCRNALGSL